MKVFCFPYAGGNADFFYILKKELAKRSIEVIALDYPGHGSRRKEVFATDFQNLSYDMLSYIEESLESDDAYALMGYSMGSIVATEILKRILATNRMKKPVHMFLAAHEPKTWNSMGALPLNMQEDVLKERLLSFGTVPEELINNNTFWRMYMPVYKADYRLIGRYNFDDLELSTDIDTTVFYSEADTPYVEMLQWCKYYQGDMKFYQFEGNHFFIKDHMKEVADIIFNRLSAS